MCGRFALGTRPLQSMSTFTCPKKLTFPPVNNIAPSQKIGVVKQQAGNSLRNLNRLRWGLVPFLAGKIKKGCRLIYARGKTVPEKPSFRAAFRKGRHFIPAVIFYEWFHTGSIKQPLYQQLTGGSALFSFAGPWESWDAVPNGSRLESCTIITTEPNSLIRQDHHRTPVILQPDHYDTWLRKLTSLKVLRGILAPYPAESMAMYHANWAANSPKNDAPACVKPLRQKKIGPNQ